ncbi:hypothetical protein BD779DRAFT_1159636 [Infundibulicybe gibba]|nr:hypothetical protein BD779DRAFT_1159636 [Infundibulicybe gibba]
MESIECTQTLSRLSLVCNLFCTMLRPRLFSKLKLDNNDERTNPPSVAFCRAILRGDTRARLLAAHIRTCEISSWPGWNPEVPNGWVGEALVMMHCRALRWIPNVEVLFLSSPRFNSGMWEVVGRSPRLRTLQISVPSQDGAPAKEIEQIARLRLSNFIIRSPAPALSRLLNPSALIEFSGDPDTLDTLLASGPITMLETLTIYQLIEARSLINTFSKVPSVRSLKVYSCIKENDGVTLKDFSTLLPNLRSLSCPPPLIMLLAPGRPLTMVDIMGTRLDPPSNLDTFLGSHEPNTTIVELRIPPIVGDETPAAGRFPCLRKLVLRNIRRPQTPAPEATAELKSLIVSSCDKWAGNPSVQELAIPIEADVFMENPLVDLALHHAVLTESLSQSFPALLRFQLGQCAVWERFAVSDAWRVLVSAKDRAGLVARLEAGDLGVVDHDGYLRRLSACNLP